MLSPGQTTAEAVVGARVGRYLPGLGDAVGDYRAFLSTLVDPALLELCRLRIAQIVNGSDDVGAVSSAARAAGITDAHLQDLANWFVSERFDAAQKACLQLAEYFCYSAQSVTDDQFADVSAHLPAEQVLGLANALWVSDSSERLANFLESIGTREAPR
jgi:hypothetical protein